MINGSDNPIFVVGTGRCGLTLLMDLISYHRDLAWPSQYLNRPYTTSRLYLSALSRFVDYFPGLPGKHTVKWVPRHSEAFHLYEHCFKGFGRPFRDLTGDDITSNVEAKFRDVFEKIMRFHRKKRIIVEYSGWPRIRFFKKIFPNAKFIHVIRDGRAVANSLLNVDYWLGWEGIYKWRWGIPPEFLLEKLKKYNHSFLALAGIQWKILIQSFLENLVALDAGHYLEIKYEDMVRSPKDTALKCLNFLGLDPSCRIFKKNLPLVKVVDANNSQFRISPWKQNLDTAQINMLNDILDKELLHYGYEI